jgi:hypothetical protein
LIVFVPISEISDITAENMFHIALEQNRKAATGVRRWRIVTDVTSS